MSETTTDLSALLAEYCHLLDDGDIENLVELFSENGTVEFMGRTFEGREKLNRFFGKIRAARAGRHLCTNAVFQVDGNTATGVSDFLFVGLDADPPQVGRYEDTYEYEAGQWRITARRIVPAQA